MTLNKLNEQIPESGRDEEAIMLYYTGADVQRLTRCVITGAQWIRIMAAIEASDFYESIYERIKQIAEDALESDERPKIRKETVHGFKMVDCRIKTTDKYWDCECEESYIHPADQQSCEKCGARREESPDSIVNEVWEAGLKLL